MDNRYLQALLRMMVVSWPKDGPKLEFLLADSGLSYQEIAQLLGKKPDAVRMLLKRSKQQAG